MGTGCSESEGSPYIWRIGSGSRLARALRYRKPCLCSKLLNDHLAGTPGHGGNQRRCVALLLSCHFAVVRAARSAWIRVV